MRQAVGTYLHAPNGRRFRYIRSFHATRILSADHYETLGVKKGATQDEIKRAFYQKAKLYHPDSNKHDSVNAQKKFVEVSSAYEILKDVDKRRTYDFGFSSTTYQQTTTKTKHRPQQTKRSSTSHTNTSNAWTNYDWDANSTSSYTSNTKTKTKEKEPEEPHFRFMDERSFEEIYEEIIKRTYGNSFKWDFPMSEEEKRKEEKKKQQRKERMKQTYTHERQSHQTKYHHAGVGAFAADMFGPDFSKMSSKIAQDVETMIREAQYRDELKAKEEREKEARHNYKEYRDAKNKEANKSYGSPFSAFYQEAETAEANTGKSFEENWYAQKNDTGPPTAIPQSFVLRNVPSMDPENPKSNTEILNEFGHTIGAVESPTDNVLKVTFGGTIVNTAKMTKDPAGNKQVEIYGGDMKDMLGRVTFYSPFGLGMIPFFGRLFNQYTFSDTKEKKIGSGWSMNIFGEWYNFDDGIHGIASAQRPHIPSLLWRIIAPGMLRKKKEWSFFIGDKRVVHPAFILFTVGARALKGY